MKALDIENLNKTYANGVHALQGVTLSVEEGDFFALLGPNGAGKSTTIGIICSLMNKTSGTVKVFDQDIDVDPLAARRYIGLVPQEYNFNLFEPIQEVLINQAGYYGIDRATARDRAEFYLGKLDLWNKRNDIPRELSGGMKRRLMIARALVHQPKLVILDEPTAGVDIEIRHSMWDFMQELNASGITIILTTHYLEEAENLCNNIAIINDGITIEQSSMRNLLDRLHTETFVLYLDTQLSELPDCGDYEARLIDPETIEVDIHRDLPINVLFEKLSSCNIKVLSMKNKTNRLEQFFINMIKEKGQAA